MRPVAASKRNQRSSGRVHGDPVALAQPELGREPPDEPVAPLTRWASDRVAGSFDELDVRRDGIAAGRTGQHEVLGPDATLEVAVGCHAGRQA